MNLNLIWIPRDPQCYYYLSFQSDFVVFSCIDYIDVYSEIKNPEDDIFDQRLSGRFCGTISPHRIVSLYSTVVIVFHTRNNTAGDDGFQGEYMFVSNG